MNRANPALIDYMQYYIDHTDASKGETYKLAKEFGSMLLENCREVVGSDPLYRDGASWFFDRALPVLMIAMRSHLPDGA